LHKLLRLQNKAVKFIANGQWNDSPNPLYNELNVLKIEQIFKIEVAKIMHRIYFKQQPQTIIQYNAGDRAFKVEEPNLKVGGAKVFIDFSPAKTCSA